MGWKTDHLQNGKQDPVENKMDPVAHFKYNLILSSSISSTALIRSRVSEQLNVSWAEKGPESRFPIPLAGTEISFSIKGTKSSWFVCDD